MSKPIISPLNLLPDSPQTEQLQTLLAEHIRRIKLDKPLYFQSYERCPGHLSQVREALVEMCFNPSDNGKSSNGISTGIDKQPLYRFADYYSAVQYGLGLKMYGYSVSIFQITNGIVDPFSTFL